MQGKANGRAHVGLFLYQVPMASELSLSVLPEVCVGLTKSPGVAAVFSINQGLSVPKGDQSILGCGSHPGAASSAAFAVHNCSSHAKQTESLKPKKV